MRSDRRSWSILTRVPLMHGYLGEPLNAGLAMGNVVRCTRPNIIWYFHSQLATAMRTINSVILCSVPVMDSTFEEDLAKNNC